MNCLTCNNLIAPNAYNCPTCGHKFRSTPVNIFFKIVLALFVLSIIVPVGFIAFLAILAAITSETRTIKTTENKIIEPNNGASFRVISLTNCPKIYSDLCVGGEVENISDEKFGTVNAVISFYTKNKELVGTASTVIDTSFSPNQRARFQTYTKYPASLNQFVTNYRLDLTDSNGNIIPSSK